ncbi:MAG TPA: phage antirepressor N-terminal domain-containing protein [Ktedonobacteraceae bacterium]|nr:phage antirepressor N-terminal domain-containing protein [Ktedonobacteraceae bacterium]
MEEQNTDVLIPARQDTIQFQKKPLVVVRLPDGQPGIVLRWICENLHLDTHAQVQRIQRTEVIADGLVYTRIETDGGPQVMPTLILRSVPYWLATIDTRRMEKEDPRRLEILEYQRNAVDALYAWATSIQEASISPLLVSDEPISKPEVPPQGATPQEWLAYNRQMVKFLEWQISVEEWRGSVEGRLDSLETVTGRILQQIGPARITTEHQTLVQFYVSKLSDITRKTHATIYAQLKTAFRVPRYDEIPESDWPRVEQWFRLQFPGKTLPESTTQSELF